MKKLIAVLLGLYPMLALTAPNPDELAICYKVKKDKIVNKGTCVISSGNMAGSLYTGVQYQGKKYYYASSGDDQANFKGYRRNSSFDRIPNSDPLVSTGKNEIICYIGKPYDICYKE